MKELRKFLCIFALFSLVFLPLSAEQYYTISENFYRVSETQLTKIEQELKNSKEKLINSNEIIEELSKQLESSNQIMKRQSQELMKQVTLLEKSERNNKFWKTATFVTSGIALSCLATTTIVLIAK